MTTTQDTFPDPFADDDEPTPSWWEGKFRGEYDSDNDRIVCEFCDWYDTGGPTACTWTYHDHIVAEHS